MGGSKTHDDWEFTSSSCNEVRTLVLIGKAGNGKSATGNSILGRRAFKSRASLSGVTRTCELRKTFLDGQIINVIDTPGLFDVSAGSEFDCKEIAKCIDLAKDGVHAVLVVFSVRNRFSEEEDAVLRNLRILFGDHIVNYIIVVFTGGDELEESGDTLEDYVDREGPDPLKDFLILCKKRMVLFDNKIKDGSVRTMQVQKLLCLVDEVINQNDGKPFTDKLFAKMKLLTSHDDQIKLLMDTVEEIRKSIKMLEIKLADEQDARMKAEKRADEAVKKSNEEISILKESLEKAQKVKEMEESQKQASSGGCTIL